MSMPIFTPSAQAVERSQMTAFIRYCTAATGTRFESSAGQIDARAFHTFSVREFRRFWRLFLDWSELAVSGEREPVCIGEDCERAQFFPALSVSYVENLLRDRRPEDGARVAITAYDEARSRVTLTRSELRDQVLAVASQLRALGVGEGDRVVAVVSNRAETVVACLASLALGATWSSTSPDLGAEATLDRFGQLAPTLLFAHPTYTQNGQTRSTEDRLRLLIEGLPSLRHVVSLGATAIAVTVDLHSVTLASLIDGARPSDLLGLERLPRLPWNHPLFILFSSGTTGRPKCIVHGAGGTLLEHHKEHRLHGDLSPADKLLFHTTCAWMMWNWQLSALACGTELVLYDGSVTFPNSDALWKIVARERVTVFGTGPGFLQLSRDESLRPGDRFDLSALRTIQSTGSILPDELFEWAVRDIKPVPIQSISGGTDIIGCFVLGNPNLEVFSGELQSMSLGLDVRAHGASEATGQIGELICANPFPSRPLGLFDDADGARFHHAYFAQHAGVWTHGDRLELTQRGGARIHGRSDGVLNVRGVRIGPAEIYHALEAVKSVVAAMAIEQIAPDEPGGSRLVLLVVLVKGLGLDSALVTQIKRELLQRCSVSHVPAAIAQVSELPTTFNGKRSERAAADALNGRPVTNASALRNPETLEAIAHHPAVSLIHKGPPTKPQDLDAASSEQIEATLTAMWEDALGISPIGRDDNFFDIGGDSLLAVTLLHRMEQVFLRRLAMSTLLSSASTIARMAVELQTPHVQGVSTIVELHRGDGGPGGSVRPPVFWVPGGGGLSVLAFRQTSLRLGHDQPVYGFEARVDLVNAPTISVEQIAAEYVSDLRKFYPSGPYWLFGYSLGAYTAFEMGVQLRRLGAEVGLLVLFDPALPIAMSWSQKARIVAQRAAYQTRTLLGGRPSEIVGRFRQAAKTATVQIKRAVTLRTRPNVAAPPGDSVFDQLDRRNRLALQAYSEQALPMFDGKVTVILASRNYRSALSPDLDTRLAWDRYATKGIETHRVPGSHGSMLEPPDVEDLAATLRSCTDAAVREGGA